VSGRTTAAAVLLGATLLGVAVAVFLVSRGPGSVSREDALLTRGRAIALDSRVTPRVHLFGEPVTAEVTAIYNRGIVKERSLRVLTDFAPYTLLGPEQHAVSSKGQLTRETWRYRLQCITRRCLPGEPKRLIDFQQGQLQYTRLDPGGVLGLPGQTRARTSTILDWPSIEVASRLSPEATQNLTWRAETSRLPAVTYRVDPTIATGVLLGGAGLLGGLALVLLLPVAPRRRHGDVYDEAAADLSPLERAIVMLEENRNGAVSDRRLTLELLARELGAAGHSDLSARARRLAWSKEAPSSEEAAGFAGTVRAAVERDSEEVE
jgi:hypothetical protein